MHTRRQRLWNLKASEKSPERVLVKRKVEYAPTAAAWLMASLGEFSQITFIDMPMRRFLPILLLLMPFAAAGQVAGGDKADEATAQRLLSQSPDQMAEVEPGVLMPLWRAPDGRMMALKANDGQTGRSPLSFRPVDVGSALSTSLQYDLGPHLQAHAGVSGESSWINTADNCPRGSTSVRCSDLSAPPRVMGSEVGATYRGGGYSVGLGIGSSRQANGAALPRVLPSGVPELSSVSGLPFDSLSSSTQLNARGRVSLDAKSGIDLGASVGRIRLLPGNLLGINAVDQKALSFGVDRGPLSGSVVGRVMQPEANAMNAVNPDRRWSAVDLGVTLRLPWQGALSIGAQNVWSSGNAPTPVLGPEPDQSRTPYVQYHQDL
jgi:hypothetical protein